MANNVIIDRRKNPGGKNTPNRQKFIKRTKEQIRRSIKDGLGDRDITGHEQGQRVKIKRNNVHEPELQNDYSTGERDFVLPGNTDYVPGDKIKKPSGGTGKGGREGSDNGESEDDFGFDLSNEEFVNILFEDLELPNMIKREERNVDFFERQRAGFSNEGNPSQLNLVQSMRNSMGRRIALKKPKQKRIKELEELIEKEKNKSKKAKLQVDLEKLKKRTRGIPFLDPTDLRYNNFIKVPKPKSQAVVFCIMDVSASMSIYHKDLAKRFFMLLNLFISRKYKHVETVFIRHHHLAYESTEEDFFYSRESGGTVVSSAYEKMLEITKTRYPSEQWNIYVAQATDGDNFLSDNEKLQTILSEQVLPIVQYLSYIHIDEGDITGIHPNAFGYSLAGVNNQLTPIMKRISDNNDNMVVKNVSSPGEVYPIFREIFGKKQNGK